MLTKKLILKVNIAIKSQKLPFTLHFLFPPLHNSYFYTILFWLHWIRLFPSLCLLFLLYRTGRCLYWLTLISLPGLKQACMTYRVGWAFSERNQTLSCIGSSSEFDLTPPGYKLMLNAQTREQWGVGDLVWLNASFLHCLASVVINSQGK